MTNNSEDRRDRVSVVGMGAVTAFGSGVGVLWKGVREGKTAIRRIKHLSTRGYSTQLGGEFDGTIAESPVAISVDGFRDRSYDMMFAAANEALCNASRVVCNVRSDRIAVVLATCNAGLLSTMEWYSNPKAHASLCQYGTPQVMAECLAKHFEFRGPVLSINTACATGANAIGLGSDIVSNEQADAVLVVGADALTGVTLAGFNCLGSLSPTPAAPYDANRTGLSLGEGAGALVLTSRNVAISNGMKPIAEVLGYGLSADGYHPTAPHPMGEGAARAILGALKDSGMSPDRIDYVNTHGTGTQKNDSAEALAMNSAIPLTKSVVPISSTKSMIGHLLGAAGVVEAIVLIEAITHQTVPVTANLVNPDTNIQLCHVKGSALKHSIDIAVSNNFAFGGANASVVIAKPGVPRSVPVSDTGKRDVYITGTAMTIADRINDGVGEGHCRTHKKDLATEKAGYTLPPMQEHAYLSRRESRRMDRLGILSTLSAGDALADAKLSVYDSKEFGVMFGTALGPMEAMEQFYEPVLRSGADAANPAVYPNLVYNAAAGVVATKFQLLGPTSTVTTGHAAGAMAFSYAASMIEADRASGMVSVATDVLNDTVCRAFADSDFAFELQPIRLAEGTAAVTLESGDHVRGRGCRPLARVVASATSFDSVDAKAASERAMLDAIALAGFDPGDVSAVWTAECGYRDRDKPLQKAFDAVFSSANTTRRLSWPLIHEPIGVGGLARIALAARQLDSEKEEIVLVNSASWGGSHHSVVLASVVDGYQSKADKV